MTCPNHLLNRFYIPVVGFKYVLQRAIEGRLEESEVRSELEKIVAYADEEEFCRATEHFPLLLSRCQVILQEVITRFGNCRVMASKLLESGIHRAGLEELQQESRVLDTAISITFIASLRAMGPTPHGPVNCLINCASQRRYELVKEIAERELLSADETPWCVQMRAAMTGVIQALPVNRRGEKARRPVALDGALADLTRAAMRMVCHEGPPDCDNETPAQPISALWSAHPLDLCLTRVFPDWPWWWIWPTKPLPEVPLRQILDGHS